MSSRRPTRPAPLPDGSTKKVKRVKMVDDSPETTVLDSGLAWTEEGLSSWLTSTDQATQTPPGPPPPSPCQESPRCPLHGSEELREGQKESFAYWYCPRPTCAMFCAKEQVGTIGALVRRQLHAEVRDRWDELTCYCGQRLTLRKSGSVTNPDCMFMACRRGGCRCFLFLDQPLSVRVREHVGRGFDDRGKKRWEDGFLMCDNGYNTLGAPCIFRGLRYRPWMKAVWDQYRWARTAEERRQLLLMAWARYDGEEGHHPESQRVLRELHAHLIEGQPRVERGTLFTPEEQDQLARLRRARLEG